ncbi:MAG: hypothetical protein ACI90V_011379 [Bacillariaceae sp.]|jgi:hypothetical protein
MRIATAKQLYIIKSCTSMKGIQDTRKGVKNEKCV